MPPKQEGMMRVKLVVVRGQPQGKSLHFPPGDFLIGRGRECFLRPNSSWVSRQHCQLHITEELAVLRDLGSTNGTLINGTRVVGERNLAHGDRIQIGPLVFEINLEPVTSRMVSTESVIPVMETTEEPGLGQKPLIPTPSSDQVEIDAASLTEPRS
jgi:pSer/pThr/pTyr-binding forkhead associated (FHA) protein